MKKSILFLPLLIVISGFIAWIVIVLHQPDKFPIYNVVIQGDYPDKVEDQLKKLVQPFVSTGFFAIDLNQVHDTIQNLLWVEHVSVRRVWPDQVVIDITKEKPVALWNKKSFLNEYGEVLVSDLLLHGTDILPEFSGPDDSTIAMLDLLQQSNVSLAHLKMKVKAIKFESNQSWVVTLDNKIKLHLGNHDVLKRVRRFVRVYSKISADHASQAKEVDLRYPHGVAVKW